MNEAPGHWLPDFCRLPRIAAVLAIAELVVVVVRLAPHPGSHWSPVEFLAASAFALWLALVLAVVYCKARPLFERLPRPLGIAGALLMPLLVGGACAWMVQFLDTGLGTHYTPPSLTAAAQTSSSHRSAPPEFFCTLTCDIAVTVAGDCR